MWGDTLVLSPLVAQLGQHLQQGSHWMHENRIFLVLYSAPGLVMGEKGDAHTVSWDLPFLSTGTSDFSPLLLLWAWQVRSAKFLLPAL